MRSDVRSLAGLGLVAWLTVAACASPPPGPFVPVAGREGAGVLGEWVHSGVYRRTYVLRTPADLSPDSVYPLLVLVHGAGGTAAGLHSWIEADSAASAARVITVYPEGLDMSWAVGCGACTSAGTQRVDDVRFVQTLIAHLVAGLPVDTARVFLAGHSLGAQFAHHYACTSARAPAAIAALSGLMLRRHSVGCSPADAFPVMMVHGDADPVLDWNGSPRDISALPMPVAFEAWADLLECTDEPRRDERPDRAGDGTSVETVRHQRCRDGTAVVLHRLRGAGHNWPGASRTAPQLGPPTDNFDGASEILAFFDRWIGLGARPAG